MRGATSTMDGMLSVVEHNVHEIRVDDERLMFHVPSSSLFAADALAANIIDALRKRSCTVDELVARLTGSTAGAAEGSVTGSTAGAPAMPAAPTTPTTFTQSEIAETLAELRALDVVSDGAAQTGDAAFVAANEVASLEVASPATNAAAGAATAAAPAANEAVPAAPRAALDTLVLNVHTGCNLSCTYCYKEDLDTPAASRRMTPDTARAAVDMLLAASPDEPRYTIVFFGGEPLGNRRLIEEVVEYCEARCAALGKTVDFVMTTNATLLTEEIVDWLDAHRFGLSVSIDGPRPVHDLNRRTVGGVGSYDVVRRKARMLLGRYRSRPVGARVTLTHGVTEVEAIWDHLINELGFAEVGFAPVTSGALDAFNLQPDELRAVFENMKALGRHYLAAALEGRNIGFSNLHQLLTDLHEGRKKRLPCGAGLKMLAVDHAGELDLCHRFTGSALPAFGNVRDGIDHARLSGFLAQRLDRSATGCARCRIRNLCAGGCYHESYARYGDAQHPTYHYCELMRDWIDFGIETWHRIMAGNPAFIDQHVTVRKYTTNTTNSTKGTLK